MRSFMHDAAQPPRRHGRRRPLGMALGAGASFVFLLSALALLAGCGALSPPGLGVTPGTTPGSHTAYAYLYSRVDYPLEIPVNSGDTVTLTLSTHENILAATPASGNGATTVGAPISLPTDLQAYKDIEAEADATAPGTSPVVWQLISEVRQSLLTPGLPSSRREYHDVAFQWHVVAVAAGQNLARITLHLYYFYLDGSQHAGTIQVTQDPIPIVAVVPAPTTSGLAQFKLPLVGLTGIGGLLGALRFLWDLLTNAKDAKEMAEAATKAAGKVQSRTGQRGQSPDNGRA